MKHKESQVELLCHWRDFSSILPVRSLVLCVTMQIWKKDMGHNITQKCKINHLFFSKVSCSLIRDYIWRHLKIFNNFSWFIWSLNSSLMTQGHLSFRNGKISSLTSTNKYIWFYQDRWYHVIVMSASQSEYPGKHCSRYLHYLAWPSCT